MPARRKSADILTLSGAIKHNGKRYLGRRLEPKDADALGEPPMHLTKDERACWRYIADCAPDNVLHKRDRVMVEQASCLLAYVRARGMANVKTAYVTRLELCLGRLGLSPSDAPRVQTVRIPEANEFDDVGPRRRF